MRVERLADDKVRIFISYEDLEERGIGREDMWKRSGRKVQELFWDMLERAYVEVGFEVAGPISVECYSMPTEGIIVIVTKVHSLPSSGESDDEEETPSDSEDETIDVLTSLVIRFRDFEDVIGVAQALCSIKYSGGSLYHYKDRYYLNIEVDSIPDDRYDSMVAILCEYGDLSGVTAHVLQEYGTCIVEDQAVETLLKHFA